MRVYTQGKIIIEKPCAVGKSENIPCSGVIEWKKESLLIYRFKLICCCNDKEILESTAALGAMCCFHIKKRLENHIYKQEWRHNYEVGHYYNLYVKADASKANRLSIFEERLKLKFKNEYNYLRKDYIMYGRNKNKFGYLFVPTASIV